MAHHRRLDKARMIRDNVLPWLRACGTLRQLGSATMLMWEPAPWMFMLRTPFSSWPPEKDRRLDYQQALVRQLLQARPVRPYGLDVWHLRAKVMSVEWDDQTMGLISFRSGPWETEVLALRGAGDPRHGEYAPT